MIIPEQPAQSLLALNDSPIRRSRWILPRTQQLVSFALMVSLGVVMLNEFGEGPLQGTFSKQDEF